MKPFKYLILSALAFGSSHAALALLGPVLQCTAVEGGHLSITNETRETASAVLETSQGKSSLQGPYHVESGSFFATITEYDLKDASGAPIVIHVSYHAHVGRGGCGRAGCPPITPGAPNTAIDAALEIGGQTLSFSCQESPLDP